MITRDGSMSKEINRRISSGRLAMVKLKKIMKDRDVTATTKPKLVETMRFPIVTYGSVSWMLRKKERKKIDAFELWTSRRTLRTPWTDIRMNASIGY
jgi:hypothetical protein